MSSYCIPRFLDVGELGVVLVVLLVLREVNCRVQRSFHGWYLREGIIANLVLYSVSSLF